ncbi:hypothetical protein HNR26_003786 [Rhizobium rosettiformans]|uniref:Uncharacterized protein n=2 Tax=Rhizobium rosettiformans TaxID=1368430 RepID=A0A4S8PTE6_9HYPH|nr:hypothetical protein [Rhizobium rosettiformans]MBB5277705.1 hypothetical protein [Rhizobium rosettiformans]THV33085.1 hypothetical protein FAA86_17990 [Rhizobium rosettiformans W3]
MTKFNPKLEAAIEAKIKAAREAMGGKTLKSEELAGFISAIDFTEEETRYMAERQTERFVRIEVGRQMFIAITDKFPHTPKEDVIPCLTAYFEAVASGEITP